VQATTHRYDSTSGDGAVITDAGLVIPFDASALIASGLRHLRIGQRLSITLTETGERVESLWIHGVGAVPQRAPRP
jgi:hypothetical protein